MATNHSGRTRQRNGIAIGEGAIRKIFPVFVLLMWITAGIWIANSQWTTLNTILALEALAICSVVFVNFVHVFNFGYAACVVVLNTTILIATGAPLGSIIVGGLLMIYGIRLFTFVTNRYRHPSFAQRRAGTVIAHKQLPFPIKVLLLINTATLMTFHAMTTYNVATKAADEGNSGLNGWLIIGGLVLAQGIAIEARADYEKQQVKRSDGAKWISSGLFARTRHPNYLGEIMMQVGVILCGIGAASNWYGYAAGFLAPTYIIILMLSATTGGEKSKRDKYSEDPEFRAYLRRSNALLPKFRKVNG